MLASRKPFILVVDDDQRVRDLIRLMLRSEGYEVMAADGGRSAVRLASDPGTPIDILITDILMPHMNGRELANRLSAMKPFLKVLFVSAYTAEILTTHNLCPEGADFIKKPFTKETLLNRISGIWASSPNWKELVSRQA